MASKQRGFAAMDPAQQREIARKGGEAVSENRQHMSEIGRKGGEASGGRRSQRALAARAAMADERMKGITQNHSPSLN